VTKRTDFPNDLDGQESPIDTPDGMADPASDEGRSADGADIASTDMSPGPSSQAETTQPAFRGGREAKVESDLAELKDRRVRQLPEAEHAGAGRAG